MADSIRQEATELLRNLIRIDTTNPPGGELAAARYIAGLAEAEGIAAEIVETAPGRGNVILKLAGRETGPPLILLSHLDVVGARPEEWRHPPFEGVIEDGYLWGRGTIDTKQLTAMELMTLFLLARDKVVPRRDVYLVATADEESGSAHGLRALLQTHGGLFRDADVVSEGGGFPVVVNGKTFYLCEVGQKGLCQVKFIYRRKPNRNPFYPDNAGLRSFAELARRIAGSAWPGTVPETTRRLIAQLMKASEDAPQGDRPLSEQVEYLKTKVSPLFGNMIKAMTESTIALTMWHGGRSRKELAGEYEAMADIRLLPGVKRQEVEARLDALCAELGIEWELIACQQGYDSGAEGRLYQEMSEAIASRVPGAALIPFIATGTSDGRYLREYDSRVFGFSPVLAEDMTFEQAVTMVHGVDERIACDSIAFGAATLHQAVLRYCTGGDDRD
ncbi:M20/M25/M40 family metallo-hydrolase [Cohnella rhizosphaerae]|uniref:M20/M25/M40 family metallo-hydrolase n=1 Tax=Cohnella rhizosphaerae TaxID=1457232 RepID=A0A9X4L0W1_9BACL|nr:M20/M25/M40 family metallo-hydrolase [Cohnella rhizosphaerae]MDG0811434.1 M20/M25/M40 family metallo-hydrolase [Cohnella rhizosphaerae]